MLSAAVEEVPPIIRIRDDVGRMEIEIQLVFSEEISDNVGQ